MEFGEFSPNMVKMTIFEILKNFLKHELRRVTHELRISDFLHECCRGHRDK
jgi:hypothetical protein